MSYKILILNPIYRNLLQVSLLLCIGYGQLLGSNIANNIQDNETIVILFHLYNLNLMNEFIKKINNFVTVNSKYQYYIKINIPVADNITSFKMSDNSSLYAIKHIVTSYQQSDLSAPYHPSIINKNCNKLCKIKNYLINNLNIKPENIQIIFSENRGADIGGFLLLLDQVIKQKINHTYIIKLHTKTNPKWRNKLLQIMNINLQKISQYRCIYGCRMYVSPNSHPLSYFGVLPWIKKLLSCFNLPQKEFKGTNHCSGTMFIVGKEITDFFAKYDRIGLYNMLNMGFPKHSGKYLIEHGFEVFLGYLIEYLKLNTLYLSDDNRS